MKRKYGKRFAMILSMKNTIDKGETVGVVGVIDPSLILRSLLQIGTEAKARPMGYFPIQKLTFNENGSTVDWEEVIRKRSGWIFELNDSK